MYVIIHELKYMLKYIEGQGVEFMAANIRSPQQKRSIEKTNRIKAKGFTLICQKGYHNVNTDDIAKYAGVSTGTIYNYFQDKRDIFMQGITTFASKILFPLEGRISYFHFTADTLEGTITKIVNHCINVHESTQYIHEEIMSMSHSDEQLSLWIQEKELQIAKEIATIIINDHPNIKNPHEKVHIVIGLIEYLCHEVVYHRHPNLDFEKMKIETIQTIISIFNI